MLSGKELIRCEQSVWLKRQCCWFRNPEESRLLEE